MKATRDVLVTAREIVQDGWCQFRLSNGRGGHCLRGAIGLAAGALRVTANDGVALDDSAVLAAVKADYAATVVVRRHLPEGFDSIPTYNDDPETSQSDVVAVLDKAISSLEPVL